MTHIATVPTEQFLMCFLFSLFLSVSSSVVLTAGQAIPHVPNTCQCRVAAEPSLGSLLSKAPHSALLQALHQPKRPTAFTDCHHKAELKSGTIQLALNRHSFALLAQSTSPSNTTGYKASGYQEKYSTWKEQHLPAPAIHPPRWFPL